MSNGNARYSWKVVRNLKEHGVDDVPQPHVPDQYCQDLSELDKAEKTFKAAIDFCKNRSKQTWRNQYGITDAESVRRQLEAALDEIQKEQQRLATTDNSRDSGLSLTTTH